MISCLCYPETLFIFYFHFSNLCYKSFMGFYLSWSLNNIQTNFPFSSFYLFDTSSSSSPYHCAVYLYGIFYLNKLPRQVYLNIFLCEYIHKQKKTCKLIYSSTLSPLLYLVSLSASLLVLFFRIELIFMHA